MAGAGPGLSIRLLGAFSVSVDGEPVGDDAWARSQAKALVKMLALEPGRRLHREVAVDRLWPELAPLRAINNLHKAIHAARRALEPGLGARGHSRFLNTRDRVLHLDGVSAVDVDAFLAGAAAARTPEAAEAALSLYAGDLLADDPYDEWAEPHRRRLRDERARLLELAADGHERAGDFARAAAAARELAADDPLDEGRHRRLMALYARAGERSKALRQFELCREALASELGAEPDEATRALHARIASGELAPAGPQQPVGGRDRIPRRATRFVGREREVAEAARMLEGSRLLTLTGPGGIGKTRLALEVCGAAGGAFPDGVVVVELGPVGEGSSVAQAVAGALHLGEERDPAAAVARRLAGRRALLVLDNCEHVVEASASLAAVLLAAAGDGVRVLATSREPLGVEGETLMRVPPLSLPGGDTSPEAVLDSEAARLFTDRARLRRPDFCVTPENAEAVAALCRGLEGLPLAIELAASRVAMLSPGQILGRLGDRLALLQGGSRTVEPRHRTIRAALDWSYELLDGAEAAMLRRLGVFRGTFDLAAAEAVCAGGVIRARDALDILGRLIDKSLVEAAAQGPGRAVRYWLLETVREYAAERLGDAGETAAVRRAHLAHYARYVDESASAFPGPRERETSRAFALELDNIRAALRHGLAAGETDLVLQLCGALNPFCPALVFMQEFRDLVEWALASAAGRRDAAYARALYSCAILARRQGDLSRAIAALEESIGVARAIGDSRRLARGLGALASILSSRGERSAPEALLDEAESLYRGLGDDVERTRLSDVRGLVALQHWDNETARDRFAEALSLYRTIGASAGQMVVLHNLGEVHLRLGDLEEADRLAGESLRIAGEIGDRIVGADTHRLLGEIAIRRGDPARGLDHFARAVEIFRADGHAFGIVLTAEAIALYLARHGERAAAAEIVRAAAAARAAHGYRAMPDELRRLESALGPRDSAAPSAALGLPEAIALGLERGAALARGTRAP